MKEKETVLVALTGGIESTVAAYLLKKQGYNCIGIAMQLFEENEDTGPFADMIVSDFNQVKAIADYLEIPFYAVNATKIFQDYVVDFVVGRVLSGQTFEPAVFYTRVLIQVLKEKAAKFNTKLIATGHYAKVLRNQKSGKFEIMVANDLVSDQSYLLARLEDEHLDGLILPLSETRKEEVLKISALIKVKYLIRDKKNRAHIMQDPRMIPFIESRVSKDLRKPGNIYRYSDDTTLGEHTGIYQYYIGKKGIKLRLELEIDPDLEVVSITPAKSFIYLGYKNLITYKNALIAQFPAEGLDMSIPLHVYVKKGPAEPKIPCILYFKNNNLCTIEYKEEQKGLLVAGQFMVFYSREGEKGKIVGSGMVEIGGTFANGDYHTLPKTAKKHEDEEEEDLNPNEKLFF